MSLEYRIVINIMILVILCNAVICWYSDLPGGRIFMLLDFVIVFLFIIGMIGAEK